MEAYYSCVKCNDEYTPIPCRRCGEPRTDTCCKHDTEYPFHLFCRECLEFIWQSYPVDPDVQRLVSSIPTCDSNHSTIIKTDQNVTVGDEALFIKTKS